MDRQGSTLQELVGDAMRDGADLARKEFALFKAEMASNATGIFKGAAMFLAAAVFAVASLIWLTQALVYGIDAFLHRPWASALIVGGLLLVVAVVLVLLGKSYVSAAGLLPNRTVQSMKRDSDVLAERAAG